MVGLLLSANLVSLHPWDGLTAAGFFLCLAAREKVRDKALSSAVN
jgi:hypothetical protein